MAELVRFSCPANVFDHEAAAIYRQRRVAIDTIDHMAELKDDQLIRQELARLIPRWENVLDVETGQPLPHPETNPQVFARIDFEQLRWLRQCLMMSPRHPNASGPAPT